MPVPDSRIPTLAEFKSLTGRNGIGRALKTKSDFGPIYAILTRGVSNADDARALRRACIAWLGTPNANARASNGAVRTLLECATNRFLAYQERTYAGAQATSGAPVAIPAKPNLPFGRDITRRNNPAEARDVARVGNQMLADRIDEMKERHWGPSVTRALNPQYANYQAAGGSLSIGAWADHVYLANLEDDPQGNYFFGGASFNTLPQGAKVTDGVKYCTPEERKEYALTFQGGRLLDCNGNEYDTTARQTHFSKYGWAIFVLGFDNVLYSNSHIVDTFHHSSFFAGNPVQCGGEICCIGGTIRYVTNKTGHYRSTPGEFYRLLSFLQYNGVDLTNVLACNDVTAGKFHLASDMFAKQGREPASPPVLPVRPVVLRLAGTPQWPVPPMRP